MVHLRLQVTNKKKVRYFTMAKQDIILGGVVKSEVKKINDNFTELYEEAGTGNSIGDL